MRHLGTLRIAGTDIEVREAEGLVNEDGDTIHGEFDQLELAIVIRAGLSPTARRDVVLHEYAHAYLYLTGTHEWLVCLVGAKQARKLGEVIARIFAPATAQAIDCGLFEVVKL